MLLTMFLFFRLNCFACYFHQYEWMDKKKRYFLNEFFYIIKKRHKNPQLEYRMLIGPMFLTNPVLSFVRSSLHSLLSRSIGWLLHYISMRLWVAATLKMKMLPNEIIWSMITIDWLLITNDQVNNIRSAIFFFIIFLFCEKYFFFFSCLFWINFIDALQFICHPLNGKSFNLNTTSLIWVFNIITKFSLFTLIFLNFIWYFKLNYLFIHIYHCYLLFNLVISLNV